jgi:hypothetical protein
MARSKKMAASAMGHAEAGGGCVPGAQTFQPGRRTLAALIFPLRVSLSTSKVSRSPTRRLSGSMPRNAVTCINISGPPESSVMKPKPRSAFHIFKLPAAIPLYFPFDLSPISASRRIGLIIGHGRCPDLLRGLILDIADVVLNGVSHPRSTSRSYLLRSTLPAVYFRPPPATIRRSSLMSSSCTIVTFLESPGSTRRRSVHQPHGESKRPRKGDGFLTQISAGGDRTGSGTDSGLRHTRGGSGGNGQQGARAQVRALIP